MGKATYSCELAEPIPSADDTDYADYHDAQEEIVENIGAEYANGGEDEYWFGEYQRDGAFAIME